jgi:gamma-glutamyl:cysteine ligase YbdK (ATP-grasp superfamily)
MNFNQYKDKIDQWQKIAADAGLTMTGGAPLPFTFWKTMIGIKRKAHQDMYNGTYKTQTNQVTANIARTIEVLDMLDKKVFLAEVKRCVPLFEADKNS